MPASARWVIIQPLFYITFLVLLLSSCTTVKFVQPYDDTLVTNTQIFYTDTALFLAESLAKSPVSRPSQEDSEHPGHYAHFEGAYQRLLVQTNALIIRAMVNSMQLGVLATEMQTKVSAMIDEALPSTCADPLWSDNGEFKSLTVRNYIDLKCLITKWQLQHKDAPGSTLTRGDWARRHRSLLEVIVAIQQAESFKQIEKTI